jgi:hypothetical protein
MLALQLMAISWAIACALLFIAYFNSLFARIRRSHERRMWRSTEFPPIGYGCRCVPLGFDMPSESPAFSVLEASAIAVAARPSVIRMNRPKEGTEDFRRRIELARQQMQSAGSYIINDEEIAIVYQGLLEQERQRIRRSVSYGYMVDLESRRVPGHENLYDGSGLPTPGDVQSLVELERELQYRVLSGMITVEEADRIRNSRQREMRLTRHEHRINPSREICAFAQRSDFNELELPTPDDHLPPAELQIYCAPGGGDIARMLNLNYGQCAGETLDRPTIPEDEQDRIIEQANQDISDFLARFRELESQAIPLDEADRTYASLGISHVERNVCAVFAMCGYTDFQIISSPEVWAIPPGMYMPVRLNMTELLLPRKFASLQAFKGHHQQHYEHISTDAWVKPLFVIGEVTWQEDIYLARSPAAIMLNEYINQWAELVVGGPLPFKATSSGFWMHMKSHFNGKNPDPCSVQSRFAGHLRSRVLSDGMTAPTFYSWWGAPDHYKDLVPTSITLRRNAN